MGIPTPANPRTDRDDGLGTFGMGNIIARDGDSMVRKKSPSSLDAHRDT